MDKEPQRKTPKLRVPPSVMILLFMLSMIVGQILVSPTQPVLAKIIIVLSEFFLAAAVVFFYSSEDLKDPKPQLGQS